MKIDRRITNGLAWVGVFLVVGIPVADLLSAQLMGDSTAPVSAQVAVVEPVAVAPVPKPARPAAPVAKPASVAKSGNGTQPGDVVGDYLSTGKKLPSYITGAETAAPAQAAAPAVVVPSQPDPVDVAALAPAEITLMPKIAPVPMPLSMRPEPVLIVDDAPRGRSIQVGPSNAGSTASVTHGDLEDWETGPLSEFLAKRQSGGRPVDPDYDPDGFFLDQGPNGGTGRDRLIGPAEETYFPFVN